MAARKINYPVRLLGSEWEKLVTLARQSHRSPAGVLRFLLERATPDALGIPQSQENVAQNQN